MSAALAPDHLIDLRKSGLTDETIARCQFESVRPHDIKLKGVESAYRLPYFDLAGKKNSLERIKLFPPVKRKDGTQKYHQAPDTAPSLYLAPLLDWGTIAQVNSPLSITEGEKKAAAVAQHRVPCIGVAGVWNWRQSLENGDRMVLPALEQFIWMGRPVELIPDSDVWRPEKHDALCGFYAMAQELVSRGAAVRFVVLPEGGQGKVGIDDWIMSALGDWHHQWETVTRIQMDDERLANACAWWQRWREKQANVAAVLRQDAEALTLTKSMDVYHVAAPQYGVVFTFERVALVRTVPQAELTVTLNGVELAACVDIGLKSADKQATLAKGLSVGVEHIGWKALIPKACTLVLRAMRSDDLPMVTLSKDSVAEPLSYAVHPLVYKNKTTVIFGDGGLGKSTFALFIGMAVTLGYPVLGMRCEKQGVLYLDYEDDKNTHTNRLKAIQEGHPELLEARMEYMNLIEPLHLHVHDILRKITTTQCRFIVLDSLLCACGGDSSAEAATKLNLAFRKLNCSVLAVGHVAKGSADAGPGAKTVYGSVFFQNLARSTFEVETHQNIDEGTAEIAFTHRKHNLSRAHPSIGVRVTQDEQTTYIHYDLCNLEEVPELSRALPVWQRIKQLLASSPPLFEEDIVKALGVSRSVVSGALSRHRGKTFKQTSLDRGASWTISEGV